MFLCPLTQACPLDGKAPAGGRGQDEPQQVGSCPRPPSPSSWVSPLRGAGSASPVSHTQAALSTLTSPHGYHPSLELPVPPTVALPLDSSRLPFLQLGPKGTEAQPRWLLPPAWPPHLSV